MDIARTYGRIQGLRVLIVEDNSDAALTMLMIVRIGRHQARVAFDDLAALRMAREFCPDIVLLDMNLPWVQSIEVAKQLKSAEATKAPFLNAITGLGSSEDRRRTLEAGVDLHLVKPVESEYLLAILSRFQHVIHDIPGGEAPCPPLAISRRS